MNLRLVRQVDDAQITPGAPFLRLPLAPSQERRRLRLYLVMLVSDIIALLAGFLLAGYAYTGLFAERMTMLELQLVLPLFLTIALYNGSYSFASLTDIRTAWLKAVIALLLAAAILNFVAFYLKANAHFSRATLSLGLAFGCALLLVVRLAIKAWIVACCRGGLHNILVIEDGGVPLALPGAFRVETATHGLSADADDPAMLDLLGRITANMDRVIVSCPPGRRGRWAYILKACGVDGEVISDTARQMGAISVRHYADAGVSTLHVSTGPLGLRARALKRAFDFTQAYVALVLLTPLMVLIAMAIRWEDGAPVLFRQRRMGRGNRLFTIYKFRTMRPAEAACDGARSAARDDERITRIGRYLRRTSLDELPQLFNVVKGEMSLVGPRPHALGSQAGDKLFWQVDGQYWRRHSLKPGMTGLARIRGQRGSTDHEDDLRERLQSDLEYLTGWSLWRDIAILAMTLRVVIHDRAY